VVTVRLPSTLHAALTTGEPPAPNRESPILEISEPVPDIAALIEVLDRRIPGFRDQLDDSVFNFAVNDEMLLFRARDRALRDGDVVEVIPTISGGGGERVCRSRVLRF
jgi:molybdopterin converting factor small subunit